MFALMLPFFIYMKSIETDVNAKKPEQADMTRDHLEICQDHLEATVASGPTPKGLCIRKPRSTQKQSCHKIRAINSSA